MRSPFVLLVIVIAACGGTTEPAPLGTLTISPASATISVGDSVTFTLTERNAAGNLVTLNDVTWGYLSDGTLSLSGGTDSVHVVGLGAGAMGITAQRGAMSAVAIVRVTGITAAKPMTNGEQIWLGPNSWTGLYGGTTSWPAVQARTHVVKLYVDAVAGAFPPDLISAVTTLNHGHLATAIEVGGVRDWNCSGASMASVEKAKLFHFVDEGGVVSFLDMDSPFGHAMVNTIPGNCGLSMTQVAQQLVPYIHEMRAAYPGVKIGLIEPVPWYSVGTYRPNPGNDFGDLPTLLDTLTAVLAAAGEHIDYFHADAPYDYDQAHPNGWAKLVALAAAVRSHGLRFGLILNSEAGGTAGDQEFHDQTLAAFTAFKNAGGRSDDVIVQSWYPHPSAMAPEGTAFTFTATAKDLIALYDLP